MNLNKSENSMDNPELEEDSNEEENKGRKEINSRYYEKEYPEVGDYVMVQIKDKLDYGYNCHIIEYNKKGMLHSNQIPRRMKFQKKNYVAHVLDIDEENGYIDIGLKNLGNVSDFESDFKQNNLINDILVSLCLTSNYSIDQLYDIIWKFEDPFKSLQNLEFENLIPTDLQPLFIDQIRKKLPPRKFKINHTFELTCSSGGVSSIVSSLKQGLSIVPSHLDITITYKSPPYYDLHYEGIEDVSLLVSNILSNIEQSISLCNGSFKLVS